MDFAVAINYINEKNKLGSVPGLDNIKELLNRLDNPQNKCTCLHIAGTNGKGSIFSFVQEILLQAGYKVGRYISPTIFDYRERFQINKEYIGEEDFAAILTEVSCAVSDMEKEGLKSPTAFEIETAVAFLYFVRERVDYALIECGMGGRLDGTNVIKEPLITVMASISMDHMDFLGHSIEEIAREKTGIIKPGCKCVSFPQSDAAAEVINEVCRKNQVTLYAVNEKDISDVKYGLEESSFSYKNHTYSTCLMGEHQIKNAATAIEVAGCIEGVTQEHIRKGLKKTVWMGRMTKVADNPLTFVDGAHNQDAWMYLKDTINKYFTNKRIIYIIGVLKDKEYGKMIDILKDTMSYAVVVTPDTPRGLDKDILVKLLRENGVVADTADNSEEALEKAKSIACDQDVILVSGSLSFIGEYMK
ncbi:MAG: bifunctional folylpolyglutamate synthase/dihydrofolate synthase [Lachnospiraceae bacterium]|nr:bifunctional folylpolyglutamate synthase/dihydrofolate synthase [Lachnospiraceae bacterium]